MPPINKNGNNKAFPTIFITRPITAKIILKTSENIKAPSANVKIVVNISFPFRNKLKSYFNILIILYHNFK